MATDSLAMESQLRSTKVDIRLDRLAADRIQLSLETAEATIVERDGTIATLKVSYSVHPLTTQC